MQPTWGPPGSCRPQMGPTMHTDSRWQVSDYMADYIPYSISYGNLTVVNSLAPGRSECDSKNVIFNLVLLIGIFRSSHDNALRWMPQDLADDQSTLVRVISWCRQATSHDLNQCWPTSLLPYGVTRPQWANEIVHFLYFMDDEAFQFTFMVMPECYDPHTSLIVQQTDGYWTSVLLYQKIIACQTDTVPERSSKMWSVLSKYNLAALDAFTQFFRIPPHGR